MIFDDFHQEQPQKKMHIGCWDNQVGRDKPNKMGAAETVSYAANISVEANGGMTKSQIESRWGSLESRSDSSFFLSSSWIGALLDTNEFVPNLIVGRIHERIVGLGLVSSNFGRRFGLSWPTLSLNETGNAERDSVMIEDNGFLAESGLEHEVTIACLHFLLDRTLDWKELRLSGVTEELAQSACRLSRQVASDHARLSPFVDLRGANGEALSWLSANTRHQIRRSLRLYGARGEVRISRSSDLAEARARFSEMETLHQRRWSTKGELGAFAEPHFRQFHEALLSRAFPLEQADILQVEAGPHTIGFLYMFFYRGEAYVYQNGFRFEEDSRLKPGLTSHILALNYCQQRGMRRYRLLAGESRYKRSLATHDTSLHWISIRRFHPIFCVESTARKIVRRNS